MKAEQGYWQDRHRLIAWPRLSLTAQIFLWGSLALGVLFVVCAISTWLVVNRQAYNQVEDNTQNILDSFDSQLKDDTNSLALLGKWLGSTNNASVFSTNLNTPEATKAMAMFLELEGLDYMFVIDEHGHVLARAGTVDYGKPGDDLSSEPDVAAALEGETRIHPKVDPSGQLTVNLVFPIRGQKSAPSVGSTTDNSASAISLGFYVDESYLKDVQKKAGLDIGLAIIAEDQLTTRALAVRGADPHLQTAGSASVNLDDRAVRSGQLVTLMTDHGPYLYRFRSISTVPDSTSILIGSGMSGAFVEREHETWLKTFGLWLLVGLADLAGIGFLMTRSLTRPLGQLSASVRRMRDGDLGRRTVLHRQDEFGELALLLDGMRQDLGKRMETLTFEKSHLELAISAISVPVVLADAQNTIMAANGAAEKLIGFGTPYLAGRAWHTLFALPAGLDAEYPLDRHPYSPPITETQISDHVRLALNTGSQPIININSAPIRIKGEIAGYVHTLQDVSEMDRFAKAKNEFLLSVGHELEGPLASWRTSLDLLLEDYGKMSRREVGLMLRTIQKTAVRFQGLVEALVDMGTLEVGKFRVQMVPTLYDKLIRDSISQIEPALRNRGQTLEINIGTPPDCRVMADRHRISQVVINLIKNASKYSPEGEAITIETHAADGQVYFEVIDRGTGIDRVEQERIFERYYRSKRVEEEGAGIGLGLALVKAIIQAHGGEIGLVSELGQGSRFWFSLAEVAAPSGDNGSGGALETLGSR